MIESVKQTLLDLRARQVQGEHMKCPRCGHDTMDMNVQRNALSRHADIHVCDGCGTAEAMLDFMNNPLPLTQWACFRDERPRRDFEALPYAMAVERLRKEQIPYLTRLFERWANEGERMDFEEYRQAAYRHCAGLSALWKQPFQAAYKVADGRLLVRFRATDDGIEVAFDLIPDK